jgi:hypothetical protein
LFVQPALLTLDIPEKDGENGQIDLKLKELTKTIIDFTEKKKEKLED